MAQLQPSSIEGIYEVCIGTRDPIPLIQYWEQFGYRIGEIGELSREAVNGLYGVNSGLRSIRLYHQDADHGLIRLMVWDNPINDGLGMVSMKVLGNRWGTALTANSLNILNHIELATAANLPLKYVKPVWDVIYNKDKKIRPFVDAAVGVREMLLLQPLTRQVIFERFNYTLPNYGKINENAAFKTSQITHAGIVIQDDSKETIRFYEEVLGLVRIRDEAETSYASESARQIFDLKPNERFIVTTFADPRSSTTNFQTLGSGLLYIIRFPDYLQLDDKFDCAKPGCLGMSLYTYRAQSIENYFERVKASAATNITDIVDNEFGEKSFSFVAPDGYFWTLIN